MISTELYEMKEILKNTIRHCYCDRVIDRDEVMKRFIASKCVRNINGTSLLYHIFQQAQIEMMRQEDTAWYWFVLQRQMIVPDPQIRQSLIHNPPDAFVADPDLWNHICSTLWELEDPALEWILFEFLLQQCPNFSELLHPENWDVPGYLEQQFQLSKIMQDAPSYPTEQSYAEFMMQMSVALEDGLLQLTEYIITGKSGVSHSHASGDLVLLVREWYADLEFALISIEEEYGYKYPIKVGESIQILVGFFLEAILGECYYQARNPRFYVFYKAILTFYFQYIVI